MIMEAEWKTRKNRIDKKLRDMNPPWEIVKYREGMDLSKLNHHAVEELPTQNGFADYALFVKGRLLGFIEAKKVSVDPQNVLEQAKRYSRDVATGSGSWGDYKVPFLYSTNGEQIWHIDVRNEKATSRKLSSFHTPVALEEFFNRFNSDAGKWLEDNPPEQISRLRNYQCKAISAIESNIADGKREMLVAMATGTGKTFNTVAEVYRLLKSGAAKRVLFLVDRKALAAQAIREFAAFTTPSGLKFNQEYEIYSQRFRREDFGDDEPFDPNVLPNEYLTNPQSTHTFVYVSTIQRMAINLFGRQAGFEQNHGDPDYEDDAETMDIPIHAFDVIIADECHRGYTAKETGLWLQTLNHFDAVKIGLTATPAAHTVAFFGKPVFRYGIQEAILDNYLVDYEAVSISSNIRMNGLFLKEGERVGLIDTETGNELLDELEDEREFSSEDIERNITSPESNELIIREVAKYAYAHEKETGRLPKILIFAVNDLQFTSHADQLVTICRKVFNQGDEFVQKITGNPNVDRPLQKIREFRNRPNPKVVVTVDMLSTGVDIPALEFIVFLRPVKSRILWEQMLGRGTRKCPDINKSHFTIFDCFGGTLIEYFKGASSFQVEELQKEAIPLEQVIENIYQNVDRDYFVKVLIKRLRRIEKSMSGEAVEAFAKYIPDGDLGRYATGLPKALRSDFNNTMGLLRNKEFQELLLNYPRARRTFIKAYEQQDVVTSEYKFRLKDKYLKPEDYLVSFSAFIKENHTKIEAIKILLDKPKGWRTKVLNALCDELAANSFAVKELQKAHEIVSHVTLADIISIVKHAAKQEEPVLTADERVNRAMERITAGKSFNGEQQKWLGLIKEHLIKNLTIDEADFRQMPVFTRHGGTGKVRQVFGDGLEALLEEINYRMAA